MSKFRIPDRYTVTAYVLLLQKKRKPEHLAAKKTSGSKGPKQKKGRNKK